MREKGEFKLPFVKYYTDIKKDYGISPKQCLTYGFIRTIIEIAESNKEKGLTKDIPCCFASSENIALNIGSKAGTVDNCISVLKNIGLIEVQNKYNSITGFKSRMIYLPGTSPKPTYNRVNAFFDENATLLSKYDIHENSQNKAIIGSLIFKTNVVESQIINFLESYSGLSVGNQLLQELYIPTNGLIDYNYLKRK